MYYGKPRSYITTSKNNKKKNNQIINQSNIFRCLQGLLSLCNLMKFSPQGRWLCMYLFLGITRSEMYYFLCKMDGKNHTIYPSLAHLNDNYPANDTMSHSCSLCSAGQIATSNRNFNYEANQLMTTESYLN